MRTIIIGDVHGCAKALEKLLEKVRPTKENMIVMLGDLFDRGPDSFDVFEMVKALASDFGERFVLLRGNHEDYLLAEKLTFSQRMVWNRVGRGTTVTSFKQHGAKMEDARPFLQEKCQLVWKNNRLQAVHAGLRVDPLEDNDVFTLIHDHSVVQENHYAGPLTVVGHIALDFPTWFKGDGESTELLPPGEWMQLPETGIICIDTGCGKGGRLTAMTIEENRYRLDSVMENGSSL